MEKDTTQFTKSEHTAARRHSLGNILVYLLLTIWALVVLFPFYWMLLTSVKSYSSYNAEHIPTFFTLTPTLQNYADAPGKISAEHTDFHSCHHCYYDGCDHTVRLCFRKA